MEFKCRCALIQTKKGKGMRLSLILKTASYVFPKLWLFSWCSFWNLIFSEFWVLHQCPRPEDCKYVWVVCAFPPAALPGRAGAYRTGCHSRSWCRRVNLHKVLFFKELSVIPSKWWMQRKSCHGQNLYKLVSYDKKTVIEESSFFLPLLFLPYPRLCKPNFSHIFPAEKRERGSCWSPQMPQGHCWSSERKIAFLKCNRKIISNI